MVQAAVITSLLTLGLTLCPQEMETLGSWGLEWRSEIESESESQTGTRSNPNGTSPFWERPCGRCCPNLGDLENLLGTCQSILVGLSRVL